MSTSTHSAKRARVDSEHLDDSSSSVHTEVARCGGEIRDDMTWTRGDFEVTTSDNVRFFVPSYHLFSQVQSKHSPVATLEAFIVACMARDDNLCALILTSRRNSKWKSVKEGAGGKEYELSQHRKESLWDPRFWPAYLWTSGVSNTYLYAVARAFGDHGTDETLADGFLHYLAQISRRNPHA
ncbi:hypothetical protein CspHIS471_0600420 [Cutaneotrichosporon sp. HIS471]|nr:hypothetical protein CspHIS471_0600420 [Cutaneotrichosporon sp. HIS471]